MRLRTLGLALVAVFAMSAVAASAAYAEELEFANFTANVPFTSSSGAGELLTVKGEKVNCTADTDKGEITGKKTDTATVTFTGCTTEVLGIKLKCTTAGQATKGTIVTNPLASTLVWLTNSKGEKVPGIDLKPAAAGGLFAEFSCEGLETIKVKGSVLVPITPFNTPSTTFNLNYKQTAGVQEYTSYKETCSGTAISDFLETKGEGSKAFGYEQSGITDNDTETFAKAQEIKAKCP